MMPAIKPSIKPLSVHQEYHDTGLALLECYHGPGINE